MTYAHLREIMPAFLALAITGIWGTLIVMGRDVPDALNNAEFTVLAFFYGSRAAEVTREAVRAATSLTNGPKP